MTTKIEKKIRVHATLTRKKSGKSSGIAEISFQGRVFRKYVDIMELKELSGCIRVSQTKKMEEWLNTEDGLKWAEETPHRPIY